jgi:hypothetical protein
MHGIEIGQCVQNVTIRNNALRNMYKMALQPSAAGACNSRPVTNIVIDSNTIEDNFGWDGGGANSSGLRIEMGADGPNAYVSDVTITNNVWQSIVGGGVGWQSAILANPGHNSGSCGDLPGTIRLIGNTVDAFGTGFNPGIFLVLNSFDGTATCTQQDWIVLNNLVRSRGGGDFISTNRAPSNWIANNNAYNDTAIGGSWTWNGMGQASLANWRSATGQDAQAQDCTASFVNLGGGDYHLTSGDICARNSGTDAAGVLGCAAGSTCLDFDGEIRPQP